MAHDHETGIQHSTSYIVESPANLNAESSDSDDHFSDALSGIGHSGATSPVFPVPRPGNLDSDPEVAGAHAHAGQRNSESDDGDTIPDEGDVGAAPAHTEPSSTSPIPSAAITEASTSPNNGEAPETITYEQRTQDAVPDIVVAPESREPSGGLAELLSPGGRSKDEEHDLTEEAKDGLGTITTSSQTPD